MIYFQNETIHPVVIDKPSLYRIVLRYINFNPQAVTGTISAVPEYNSNIDVEQKFQVSVTLAKRFFDFWKIFIFNYVRF